MTQTVSARALELGPNAIDLRGQKFGQLEPIRVVAKRHVGNVWLCLCDCGRFATRTAAALRQAVRDHETPMCKQCQDELSRGLHIEAGNQRKEGLRRLWRRRGKLYSDRALAHYTDQIRAAVAAELGIDEPTCDDAPALPVWGLSLADAAAAVDAPRVHCSPPRPSIDLAQYQRAQAAVADRARLVDEALERTKPRPPPAPARPRGPLRDYTPAACVHFYVEAGPGVAACKWCSSRVHFNPLFPVQFAK